MRIKTSLRRLVAALTAITVSVIGVTTISATPAQAFPTKCRTVALNNGGAWTLPIQPWMYVPVCYNGSQVWQNGNVTSGVNTFGYTLNGIDWAGTYNGGGNWLGAGINYRVTIVGGWWGQSCATRWTINSLGNSISYRSNC
jgi:hypothetical protein